MLSDNNSYPIYKQNQSIQLVNKYIQYCLYVGFQYKEDLLCICYYEILFKCLNISHYRLVFYQRLF